LGEEKERKKRKEKKRKEKKRKDLLYRGERERV